MARCEGRAAWRLFLGGFALLFEEEVECGGHRRCLGARCLAVETQAGLFHGFGRCGAEGSYLDVALLKVGEVFQQRLYTGRAEKDEHVVVERLVGTEVVAHRAVHHGLGVVDFVLVEQRIFAVVYIGYGQQELLAVVLAQRGYEVVELTGVAEEYFALAVDGIFLQIEGNGLGRAEIFHGFGYGDPQAFTQGEKVVNGCTGGEDDSRVFGQRYFLLTEFFR